MIQTPETRGEGVTKTPEKGKAAAHRSPDLCVRSLSAWALQSHCPAVNSFPLGMLPDPCAPQLSPRCNPG